jgi:hypothetical protein
VGTTVDVLYEIRRAMRVLRRAEKIIVTEHRAVKRKFKQSQEWAEAKRIREHEAGKP